MKTDIRNLIMIVAYCLVLCILLVPQAALAQPDTWVTYSPGRTWAVTDIRHIGSLNMSQDYSHSYSGNNVSEEFAHSFYANATEGKTRIYDVLSVVPTNRGSRLWSATSIGYNPLGTTGRLSGGEDTTVGVLYTAKRALCQPEGRLCSSAGSRFMLTYGSVHTSARANNPMSLAEYEFSSLGEGEVSTGCNVISGSGEPQTSYSQLITVEGEFNIDYSANFNL